MTTRQFAKYDGLKVKTVEHPDNDIPEHDSINDVPVMPMKKQTPMAKSNGWHKSVLSNVGKSKDGDILTLKDDLGYIQIAWKRVSAATCRNLVNIINGSDAKWRIRWFSDSNGVRRATEILTDEQYREYSKASWQNRKVWREGFATANPFMA